MKILIVDDVASSLEQLKSLLEGNRHTVSAAVECEAALSLYQVEINSPFDMVIVGLEVPKMGGLEFILKIREINPNARIWSHARDDSASTWLKMADARTIGAEEIMHKDLLVIRLQRAEII